MNQKKIALLLLVFLTASAQVDISREGGIGFHCVDAQNKIVSSHTQEYKATESCLNELLADPDGEYSVISTGRLRFAFSDALADAFLGTTVNPATGAPPTPSEATVAVISGDALERHPAAYETVVKGGEDDAQAGFALIFAQGNDPTLSDPIDAFGIGSMPLFWSQMEPSDNTYNWTYIDTNGNGRAYSLAELRAVDRKGIFRITWGALGTNVDRTPTNSVPLWAVDACNIIDPGSVVTSDPGSSSASEWNIWNPCLRDHLFDFLDAVVARYGIGGTHDASDVILAVQASAHKYGEATYNTSWFTANDPSYTQINYETWCEGMIDRLATGFGKEKVMSAWGKDDEPPGTWDNNCRLYAVDTVGTGVRDGLATDNMRAGVEPSKKRFTKSRKLVYTEDAGAGTTGGLRHYIKGANHAGNFGLADLSEGEEDPQNGFANSASNQIYPVYHNFSAKALAFGLTLNNTDPRLTSTTWWDDASVADFRKSAEWMRRNMGYPDADRVGGCSVAPNQCAPQAFSLLYVMGQITPFTDDCTDEIEQWHWESHLWHRAVAGNGTPVPAKKYTLPTSRLTGFCEKTGQRYIYQAMSTSGANTRLYFDLATAWSAPNDVDVLVTYYDENTGTAQLRYCSTTGELTTPIWSFDNTGDVKTAVINLPDFVPDGCLTGTNDLAVERVSGGELAVQMVRVLRN